MSVTLNRVRRGFYADSVALMRISRALSGLPGVEAVSLMIGTPSNRDLLSESELLDIDGAKAQADDLIIAVRAGEAAAAEAALAEAEKLLAAWRRCGALLQRSLRCPKPTSR
jgi:FdrA protein